MNTSRENYISMTEVTKGKGNSTTLFYNNDVHINNVEHETHTNALLAELKRVREKKQIPEYTLWLF